MRTNPVSNHTHHDSMPTSPASPEYSSSEDSNFLLSTPRGTDPNDLFFIPRISFFQCEAHEFEQRRNELATRGFICYEPVIQGTTYNVTYMRIEGLRSIALQMLEAGDASGSEELEEGEIRD